MTRPLRTRGSERAETEHGYWLPVSDKQVDELAKRGYTGKRPTSSAHASELLRQFKPKVPKAKAEIADAHVRAVAHRLGFSAEFARLLELADPDRRRSEAERVLRELGAIRGARASRADYELLRRRILQIARNGP